MKRKVHYQIQPRQTVPPPSGQIHVEQIQVEQAQEEIDNFLQALESYPARAAKEPHVTFQQHITSIFAADRSTPRRRH
jgi:hypothetical protein